MTREVVGVDAIVDECRGWILIIEGQSGCNCSNYRITIDLRFFDEEKRTDFGY